MTQLELFPVPVRRRVMTQIELFPVPKQKAPVVRYTRTYPQPCPAARPVQLPVFERLYHPGYRCVRGCRL